MSVLALQRMIALRGERSPTRQLPTLGSLGEQSEYRERDKVLTCQDEIANDSSEGGRHPQVALPYAAEPFMPQRPLVTLRRDASQLCKGVVHVKHLVAQDLLENRARQHI